MLVLELHLPSRKDNQLTGVFNLKYSHWTMEHPAQPLHRGKAWTRLQSLTGEHISPVLLVCRQSLPSNSQKVELHGAFQKSLARWRSGYGSLCHLASEIFLYSRFSQRPVPEVELLQPASVCRAYGGFMKMGSSANEGKKRTNKGSGKTDKGQGCWKKCPNAITIAQHKSTTKKNKM